jgi:hypothetical protein
VYQTNTKGSRQEAKIEKSHEVSFILRKINSKVARKKDEVECIFFLHGMNSIKFLCPLEL